ncbi:hypothetical protein ACT8ZV_07335 [Nocardioides sp. MAHUQ-72]|uniref:hypothetical protein n=1 Tax=unclassified Nocardioides TaxID=2615069 RepID=UPI003616DD24
MTSRGTGPGVRRVLAAAGAAAVTAIATTSCAGGPPTVAPSGVDGLEIPTPSADPRDFVDHVDNRWFPLEPGTVWTYRRTGEGDARTEVVTVTDRTRVVQGVSTTVVRDVVTGADGKVVSTSSAWYAQDVDGNVWKLGESASGRRGSGSGSWEAGVDGAEAGLVMAARPRVGDGYAQERAPGVAEDRSEVLSVNEQRTVPLGEYDDLVQTEDSSLLDPGLVERRYYAPGVGLVYVETVAGGTGSTELVAQTHD